MDSNKAIGPERLVRTLLTLGFEERTGGKHRVLRHTNTGLIIVLPSSSELLPVTLHSIARQIAYYGIVSEEDLFERLRK
jgi:predicted RNA binding protein YcfA (HicA-like mRNA interferase family)